MPNDNEDASASKVMKKKKMSKTAYRVQLLGICVSTLRSVLFNATVFCIGCVIGMGVTIIHIQNVWKNDHEKIILTNLQKTMQEHRQIYDEIKVAIDELKEMQVKQQQHEE